MITSRGRILRRLGVAAFAASIVVAGCTTTIHGAKDDPPSTSLSVDASSSTTTSSKGGSSTVTVAQLRTLLPTADQAGPDYTANDVKADLSHASDADDPFTAAMNKSCPEAQKLMDTDGDDPDNYAGRLFNADDNRQIGVYLLLATDPHAGFTTKDEFDALVTASTKCPRVSAMDQGVQESLEGIEAQASNVYGDFGAILTGDFQLSGGSFAHPVTLHQALVIFQVDGVDVLVQSTDGVASDGTVSPVDQSTVQAMASEIATRLGNLEPTH